MRKTDKKRENQIRMVLTDVCELALKQVDGFQWLTHVVNYSNFPSSLKVTCVFDTDEQLTAFSEGDKYQYLTELIIKKLAEADIKINNPKAQIEYCTEEQYSLRNG